MRRWLALVGVGLACGIGTVAGCELALVSGWGVGDLLVGVIATGLVFVLDV